MLSRTGNDEESSRTDLDDDVVDDDVTSFSALDVVETGNYEEEPRERRKGGAEH